ncbi:MAG: hypothetical protein CSB55_00705 [Candidatus Cloacimonadota bacterium]|nr:MAG: hypothetical protein CSB55_00705 [Candidatus Cloacimonadota bacterium]
MKISAFFQSFGAYCLFIFDVLKQIHKIPYRFPEIIRQMKSVGFDSLIIMTVTSAFTGFVTAVQASYQTNGYIPKSLIGVMVSKSTMIELGPVLTSLVLSGKIGASLAAEIGTMKVSEQLEALESLAVDVSDYLYLPRIFSGIIMFPVLTVYANFVTIISAYFLSALYYKINYYTFFGNMKAFFHPADLWSGILKAFLFGFVVSSAGCFMGSRTANGSEGVGRAATDTVVYSSIALLIVDFLVASFLFGGVN